MHTHSVLHAKETKSPRKANKSNLCSLQAALKSNVEMQTLYVCIPRRGLGADYRTRSLQEIGNSQTSGDSVAVVLSRMTPRGCCSQGLRPPVAVALTVVILGGCKLLGSLTRKWKLWRNSVPRQKQTQGISQNQKD